MWPFVGLLSVVGLFVGLVSIIYPLRVIHIHSRRMAGAVFAASFAIFAIAIANTPDSRQERQQRAFVAPRNVIIDDGCDGVANPIPNCHEEVKRIAAAQAALPPLPPTSDQPRRSYGGGTDLIQQWQNDIKAAEATANRRALEAQRELERASFDSDYARQNVRNSIQNLDDQQRRSQAELERSRYGRSVEMRKLEKEQQERIDRLEREVTEAKQKGIGYTGR
jgi:hypothetical protein